MTRQVSSSSTKSNSKQQQQQLQLQPMQQQFNGVGTLRRQHGGMAGGSGRFKVIMQQQHQQQQQPGMNAEKQQVQKMNALNNNNHNNGNGGVHDNGTTELSKNLLDLDAGSFCYNGLADSGCGGSPSPMAMLMSHDDDQALYHMADGDLDGDMERLYVKVDEQQQQQHKQQQQQQHLLPLAPSNQVHPSVAITLNANNSANSWRTTQSKQQQQPQQPFVRASYRAGSGSNNLMMTSSSSSAAKSNTSSSIGGSSSLSSCSESAEEARQQQQHKMLQSGDCDLIYAPSSVASERSLLSSSGSGCGSGGSMSAHPQGPLV
uniref:Uncharacterized protein n=1 Tax=Zeugodacus cucurbitae TaxID=28588 RepID=A0A0A1X1J9_ZEUCU